MAADMALAEIIYRFSELLAAPYRNPDMLWFGLPLIATIIVAELYLDLRRRTNAVLVGNIAMLNAIVLCFVGLDVMRMAFSGEEGFLQSIISSRFFLSLLILIIAAVLFTLDSLGRFPRKTFLRISAHLPFNFTAYVAMAAAYNNMALGISTIAAWILLMILFWVVFVLVTLIKFPFNRRSERKDSKTERKRKDLF